jgi:hypothetical protein
VSHAGGLLFWAGSGSYAFFGLVWFTVIWCCHASVFAITRFDRLRGLVLNERADQVAFDRRSRELLVIASVLLVFYLFLLCCLNM